MSFLRFRTLDAPANPLLAKYTAATGRTVQDTIAPTPAADGTDWIPVDTSPWQSLYAAMTPGVLDHTTPGLPTPANQEGTIS